MRRLKSIVGILTAVFVFAFSQLAFARDGELVGTDISPHIGNFQIGTVLNQDELPEDMQYSIQQVASDTMYVRAHSGSESFQLKINPETNEITAFIFDVLPSSAFPIKFNANRSVVQAFFDQAANIITEQYGAPTTTGTMLCNGSKYPYMRFYEKGKYEYFLGPMTPAYGLKKVVTMTPFLTTTLNSSSVSLRFIVRKI